MALAVGVVDLRHDADQPAMAVVAPEDRERVEDVPEDARVREHEDSRAVPELDAAQRQELLDVRLDRQRRGTEMVRTAESCDRAEVRRLLRYRGEAPEPLVCAVPERVTDR